MWGRHSIASSENPYQRREKRRVQMRNPSILIQKRFFRWSISTLSLKNIPLKKPFLFPEIPETATTKASCSQSTHFFCTFWSHISGRRWREKILNHKANILARAKVFQDSDQSYSSSLQSSNNNERKIQPTHIKNILTWYLNHHLDPGELVSAVSGRKAFEQHLTCQTSQGEHDWMDRRDLWGHIFFTHPPPFWMGFHTRKLLFPAPQPWSFLSRISWLWHPTATEDSAQKRARCRIGHFQLWSPLPWPLWALELVTCLLKPLHPPHQKKCNNIYFSTMSLTRLNEIIMIALIDWVSAIMPSFQKQLNMF